MYNKFKEKNLLNVKVYAIIFRKLILPIWVLFGVGVLSSIPAPKVVIGQNWVVWPFRNITVCTAWNKQ